MKNNLKRCLAMFLAVMMVVGSFAIPVVAADVEDAIDKPDPDKCEHNWSKEPTTTVEPTCTTQGYDLHYCDKCFTYEQRNITDKTDHVWEEVGVKLPTCTVAGHPEGVACKNCGLFDGTIPDEYKAQPVCGNNCDVATNKHAMDPAKGCYHVWGDPVSKGTPCVDKNATITYTCTEAGCGHVHVETSNGKHDYNYIDSTLVAPSCHEATKEDANRGLGSIKRVCSICKDEQTVIIERIAHTYETSAAGSSDTKCGETCKVCGKKQASDTDHVWTKGDPVVDKPSCGVEGSKTWTCTLCEYEKIEKIDALVHGVSAHTVPDANNPNKKHGQDKKVSEQALVHTPTELVDNTITWHCDMCDKDWVETVKKAEHYIATEEGFEDAKIDPTCTLPGVKFGRCSCGKITSKEIPALGHMIDTTIDPDTKNYTCENGGYYIYTCGRVINAAGDKCGAKFNVDVEPGTHNIVKVDIPAKCGEPGYKGEKCTRCPYEDIEELKQLHDHNVKVIATFGKGCVDDIVVYSYCDCGANSTCNCDYHYDISVFAQLSGDVLIAALDAASASNTGKKIWKEVTPKKGSHSMSDETVIIPSTCHETGWKGYKCENCDLLIKTKPVEKLDVDNHDYPTQQYLVNFRWSCYANGGEQLYSDIYCAACKNIYTVKTVVPATGLDIAVDTYVQFNPETNTYTTVVVDPATHEDATFVARGYLKSITLYVDGLVKAQPTTLTILAKDIASAKKDVISAGTGHVWVTVTAADCKNDGTKKCAFCTEEGTIDKTTAHVLDESTKQPVPSDKPCAVQGTWTGKCGVCDIDMSGKLDLEAHKATKDEQYRYLASAATCTANAEYYDVCSECDAKLTSTTAKADTKLEHTYDQEKVCAEGCTHTAGTAGCYLVPGVTVTCIQKAKYYKSCKCGAVGTETFEAGNYGECKKGSRPGYQAAANEVCTKYSYNESWYCDVCDTVYTWDDFVAVKPHAPADKPETLEANCLRPEIKYWNCKYCGLSADTEGYFFDVVWGEKNGPHTNNHGEHLTGNCKYIPSEKCDIQHNVTYNKIACGKEGCAFDDAACGVTHVSIPVISNPCGEGNWTKDANGEYVLDYFCIHCKEDILPDQHTYSADTTTVVCGIKTEICTNCGYKNVTGKADHTYVKDVEASVDPTTETKGELVEVCSECGDVKKTELAKLPSLVFSLEIANPNGGDIVTGGKAYLTIKIDAIDVDVTSVCLKLNVSKYLKNVEVVADDYALGGYVVAHANANNVVTVWADANSEQKFVNLDGEYVLCVLAFDVDYDGMSVQAGIIDNDLLKTSVNFVEPVVDNPKTEAVEEDPQIMVLNPDNERETFDVTAFNKIDVAINQIADANDDAVVNSQDALIIRQAIEARLAGSEEYEYDSVLDINKDGEIGTADYVLVMQYIVGMKDYADLVAE